MKDKDVSDQREEAKVPAQMQPMQVLRSEHGWDGHWISHYPAPRLQPIYNYTRLRSRARVRPRASTGAGVRWLR